MEMDEMKQSIEALEAEIPADDTSSFSFDKKSKDGDNNDGSSDNSEGIITIDILFDMFDDLNDKGLGDKTEEGQELRAKIREFIEQEGLKTRITRATTNSALLDMIEEELQNGTGSSENQNTESDKTEDEQTHAPDPEPVQEQEDENPRSTRNDDTNEPAERAERRNRSARTRRER